ncbi:hypothetical protein ACWD7C_14460 [Streptomyces sp. NPDC005134]|uniref:hypothetical protein n=1 Tax=Streptomyces sp. NPDC005098 TaxID=3154560 RepID=UPI0033A2979F
MVQVAFPDDGSGTAVTEMMEGDAGNYCFRSDKVLKYAVYARKRAVPSVVSWAPTPLTGSE